MSNQPVSMDALEIERLVKAACPEAALLYLYQKSGKPMEDAQKALRLSEEDFRKAAEVLSALGLIKQKEIYLPSSELPDYHPQEVVREYTQDTAFSSMIGQTQRRLGRLLTTEEIKTFLGIYRHLGISPEVISILVSFCVQKNALRGSRMPTVRAMEKEAYHWSELGIETMEQAAEYMQQQLRETGREAKLCKLLQLGGRKPTAAEEKYLQQWMTWGFSDEVIALAYDKTCVNAGGLKWPYMHAILKSWQEKNLMTPEQIAQGDRKEQPSRKPAAQKHDAELSALEKKRIAQMMKKGLYKED